jgi:Na+-translocating ferredoxin:NAD+ oxidoreductase RnfC subunit
VGVIVLNGESAYNIALAVDEGEPVTEKWVTIGGNIQNRVVVRVPVGMRVADVFRTLNITVPEGHTVLDGGPSMGRKIRVATAVIGKTTKSLLILPDEAPAIAHKNTSIPDMLRRAASCCCGCSRCTEMCPRHLLGYPIEPHKMIRAANNDLAKKNPELIKAASLCCSCGVCAEVCCQDISPKDVILSLKGLLAKNGLRYTTPKDTDFAPAADRAYHMIPSTRWESMLGVKRFDLAPELIDAPLTARQVEIALRAHIGAPSVPTVKIGDTVKKGEVIAAAADGLSLPQHASIDGKITLVDNAKIVISAI